ncbi:MAG TPA: heat-inducible transcription repressor HrcA [Clostridiaceae bacterium]|nr:heat-inducible transcription repressor HrcA [Clostridiaceae bacterium]
MILDNRKRRILQAIVDDYIDTAEPVGSRTIARKHELGLSSATIRNEMADLEEMGYLEQPHTSAGRIPSDKGYRYYVDELMQVKELTEEEIRNIEQAMEVRVSEIGQLIKLASTVMSRFTKYTSMAVTPNMKKSLLKAVQVVPVETGKALVVVVTNTGMVKNFLIKISDSIVSEDLIKVSNMLNDKFANFAIEDIKQPSIKDMGNEIEVPRDILLPVIEKVVGCIKQIDAPEVFIDGVTNIFNYPEFRNVAKAREFLSTLDEKENLSKILSSTGQNNNSVSVRIGTENILDEIKECSLLTATYSLGNVVIGSLGVIGPTRMEYPRVISSINYIRKKINEEISKLLEEGLEIDT